MLDLNFTTGALFGYSSENSIVSLNVPATRQTAQLRLLVQTSENNAYTAAHRHPTECLRAQR